MATKKSNQAYPSVPPAGMDDWQTEDDLRTIQRADEIKDDPKRLAKVKKLAKHKLECLTELIQGEKK